MTSKQITVQVFRTKFSPGPSPSMSFKNVDGLTLQNFAEECDINTIIRKYRQTGMLTNPLQRPTRQPMFEDFSNAVEFSEAQRIVARGQQQFESLPAHVRAEFGHDPVRFLDFINDITVDKAKRLETLGLCQVREEPSPKQAEG